MSSENKECVVLCSKIEVKVSNLITQAFIAMRKTLEIHVLLFREWIIYYRSTTKTIEWSVHKKSSN